MAVDTQEKRMNVRTVGRPWMRGRLAVGATDVQARMATGLTYGGNPLAAVAALLREYFVHIVRRKRRR